MSTPWTDTYIAVKRHFQLYAEFIHSGRVEHYTADLRNNPITVFLIKFTEDRVMHCANDFQALTPQLLVDLCSGGNEQV